MSTGQGARRGVGLFAAAIVLALAGPVLAHSAEVVPPVPHGPLTAPWPSGHAEEHDVIVPLVVVVDSDGKVSDVELEAYVSEAFDAAAIEAARGFSFEPATQDGEAIPAKIRIVVRFLGQSKALEHELEPHPQLESTAPEEPPAEVTHTEDHTPAPEVEVVVSGQASRARTASEKVIGRPVLQAAPQRTAADLLRTVPGVFLTQHSGEGKAYQIFYRGFDAVHGQDLEIWAGGAPVNDVSNIHGQGYADLNFLMPEVVQSIHVSPGTYDPRQGDFSVAGSLRMTLGYDQPGVTAKGTLGQFGTRRYFLAYRPRDMSSENFAAFETYGTDGFGPSRSARRTSGVAQTAFELSDGIHLRLLATGYAAHFDSAGVLRLADIYSGKLSRFATYDPKQGGSANRSSLVMEFEHDHGAGHWSFAPYLVMHSMRLRQDLTGFLPDTARNDSSGADGNSEQQLNDALTFGSRSFYHYDLEWLSVEDSMEVGLITRLDWIEQSQRRLSVFTDQVTLNEVDARVRATNIGGYLDIDLHPAERWHLQGGLRLDGLSYTVEDSGESAQGEARSAQGAHLGKKASAAFQVLKELSAVASYGEGFRSPQARSLSEGQTTPFTQVQSYEAGLRFQDQRMKASLAGFQTHLSDDLVFDQASARNVTTPATLRTGITVDVTTMVRPWFVSSASLTHTRAEFARTGRGYQAGELVPYTPQTVARTDLSFTPVLGRVYNHDLRGRLGFATTFLARRPLPYGEFGHNAFLVDTRAALRWRQVELSADVWNLLNAKWFDGEFVYASNFVPGTAASLVPERHVTVGAPRSAWLTLSLYL